MLNPEETDRERLLRLIDGGPEALREVQEQRKPMEEKKTPVITPVTPVRPAKNEDFFETAKKWAENVPMDRAKALKLAVVVLLLILAFRAAGIISKPAPTKAAEATALPAAALPVPASDEGTGLRLVGVDWDEPPVALLEDLNTGKTYFARKDDKIKETRVKQIFKDKVVVTLRGRTLELR